MADDNRLEARRRAVLEERFTNYDFGFQVEESDGWSTETPETEWVRVVYFENDENPSEGSIKGYFVVRFAANSAVVVDEYATMNGTLFGNPTTEANTSTEIFEVLGQVPVTDNGLLETDFMGFPKGTRRENVWTWLEARNPDFSVHATQFPK